VLELLRLGALGGLLGLDGTAVGQVMVSRPLVAGVLTGFALGDPALGGAIGAILELYLLVSFPSGGARFPEGSTATVVAVSVAAPLSGPGVLPIAVAFGLACGQLAGSTVSAQRRLNTAIVPEAGSRHAGRVARAHLVAIALDWARGTVVTVACIVAGRGIIAGLVVKWPLGGEPTRELVLVGGAVSMGILLRDLGGFRKRRVWLALGLALGLVGARFL
jgi:PTS system mannose-specific IIC component